MQRAIPIVTKCAFIHISSNKSHAVDPGFAMHGIKEPILFSQLSEIWYFCRNVDKEFWVGALFPFCVLCMKRAVGVNLSRLHTADFFFNLHDAWNEFVSYIFLWFDFHDSVFSNREFAFEKHWYLSLLTASSFMKDVSVFSFCYINI